MDWLKRMTAHHYILKFHCTVTVLSLYITLSQSSLEACTLALLPDESLVCFFLVPIIVLNCITYEMHDVCLVTLEDCSSSLVSLTKNDYKSTLRLWALSPCYGLCVPMYFKIMSWTFHSWCRQPDRECSKY